MITAIYARNTVRIGRPEQYGPVAAMIWSLAVLARRLSE